MKNIFSLRDIARIHIGENTSHLLEDTTKSLHIHVYFFRLLMVMSRYIYKT